MPDGSVTNLRDRVGAPVVPHPTEHWYIEDHRDKKVPSLRWEAELTNVIQQTAPVELRVKGQLRSQGRGVEEFDFVLHIPLRYETSTRTGWQWLGLP